MPEKLGAAVKRKRQRTRSFDAFVASMLECGAARVPEMSAPGSDQPEPLPPPPHPAATSASAAPRAVAHRAVVAAGIR
jgi:hypothetical protein